MKSRLLLTLCVPFLLQLVGCATVKQMVPNALKSNEQIQLEDLTKKKELAIAANAELMGKLESALTTAQDGKLTTDIAKYRRLYLRERQAYVSSLLAEEAEREAQLNKKSKKSGYFALGTKSIGIFSGIASAVLVAASPANAATVAGFGALSSGSAALQDTASSVGYSTVIADAQLEALKTATNTAYLELKNTPWDYLFSLAGSADQTTWDGEMKKLGSAIISIEAAVRFTKFEIKVSGTAQ